MLISIFYILRRLSAFVFLALVLVGCTADAVPSEATAKEAYGAFLAREECNQQLKLSKFKKTNGRKPGDGEYLISFEAEIDIIRNSPRLEYCTRGENFLGYGGKLKAGESQRLEGELRLLKTEKGWKLGGLNVNYKEVVRSN